MKYHVYIMYDIIWNIIYDFIMTSTTSLSSTATLGSASRISCLAVWLHSLCCLGPALADTLAPDLSASAMDTIWASGGCCSRVTSRCSPHRACCCCPGPAACKQRCFQDTDCPWRCVESWGDCSSCHWWNTEWEGAPQHVSNRADLEAGQALVAGQA